MIKFEISSQIVEIAPNNTAQVALAVTNVSQIIDFFTVSVEPLISPETMGLYPGWVEIAQPSFSLRPAGDSGRGGDSQQTVTIKVSIPPQVYAGNYAGQILITARSGADNSAEIPFNIVVSQIDAQTLEIQPIDSSSRKSTEVYRVVVSNQGNAPHIYSVYAEDPNDDLKFTIDPPEVPLRPGEQAAITLKAQPRQRNWVGDEQNHDFKVKLEGSDQEIRGSFKQKAAIAPLHWFGRHWGRVVFFLALFLVLLIVGSIFLLPLIFKTNVSAECTVVSQRKVNVYSNGTTTNIMVSSRTGAEPYTVAVSEQADRLPGIYASLVSVSPDGRRIAYVTGSDLAMNDARIVIKNLDTDQPALATIPITSGVKLWPVAPVWSSNGEKLAFFVRHPTPVKAAAATAAATTIPAVAGTPGASGTATTTTAAATTAAAAQTPGGEQVNPSQLDLMLVSKFGEDPKGLGGPAGLEPKLFYGNTIGTQPVCFASDDQSFLVLPPNNDNKGVLVSLADGKATEITTKPKAINNVLNKANLPGLVMPFDSMVGVPASLIKVPSYQLASIQQQTGATSTPKGGTTGATTAPAKAPVNTCAIQRPFSQNDPRWADLPLTTNTSSTMAELGCPITAAAILLQYQQVDTNPADLSSCLGTLTSPLNQPGWFAIGQQCGSFSLQGGVRSDFSWDLLDSSLQTGPTVVGLLGGPSGTHFVVVTGGTDNVSNSYTVADPWDGSTYKTLDYFLSKGYRPRWVISYTGPSAPCVTNTPDITNQASIRTSGATDGGLYQTAQPFRYEVVGTNDPATASLRIVNPRTNLDDNGKTLLPNETQTFSVEGNYSINIAVKNSAGDSYLTRDIYFTIDHTPPVLGYRLNPTVDKATNKSLVPVSVQLSAADDLSGIALIEYQINGSQWQAYTSDTARVPLTISDNGTYTINYRATDGAGNLAAAETINFVIEKPVAPANAGGGSRPGNGAAGATTPTPGGANAGAGGAAAAKTTAPNVVVPTVTPAPSATPRPVVKNTPTVARTTAPPTTTAPSPTTTAISLLPTGTPAITPTQVVSTTAPISTTVAGTPSPTVELKAVLNVPNKTLKFLPNNTTLQLQFQNDGNAPLIWSIDAGSNNDKVSFSATTGTLGIGETSLVNVKVLNLNLGTGDQNFTFDLTSNGGSQTIGVIIQPQPRPSANLALVPNSNTLNPSSLIQVDISVPNPDIVKPDHVDLYATYMGCVSSCAPDKVKIATLPYTQTSNSAVLTSTWDTSNIVPQNNISLEGEICLNQSCSITQTTNPLNDLQIEMTASFQPVTDNKLTPNTTLTITNPSERTKEVKVYAVIDGSSPTFLGDVNLTNNWTLTWDTSLISPFSNVEIRGDACNTVNESGVCLPIPALTGLKTFMTGTVTTIPNLATDPKPALSSPISFTVAPSTNVKSILVEANYVAQAGQSPAVAQVGTALNEPWVVTVDPTQWPAQQNISFNVKVCFTQDSSSCTQVATYTGLSVPAGDPSLITDLTAEPKYTTVNTVFPNPLKVRVTDSKQNPVAGRAVNFVINSVSGQPAGTFGPPTNSGTTGGNGPSVQVVTNSDGVAEVGASLTANGIEGVFYVNIATADRKAATVMSLTNVAPGAKPMIRKQGNDQTARIGQTFQTKLQVQLDAPNVQVTFSATGTGTGAHFSNNTATYVATTDANGVATAIDLIANISQFEQGFPYPVVGTHTVRVSANGYSPAVFNLTNIVGDPASVTPIAPTSQSKTIDTAYDDVVVQIKDVGGNLLRSTPSQKLEVTFQSPSDPTQPGALFLNSDNTYKSSVTVQASPQDETNPIATTTGIKANTKAGNYNITATVVGYPAATPGTFAFKNLVGAPASVQISALTASSVLAAGNYTEPLKATVYDKGGNQVLDTTTKVVFTAPTADPKDPTKSSVLFNNTSTIFTTTIAADGVATTGATPIVGTCFKGGFAVTASLPDFADVASNSTNLTLINGIPAQFVGDAVGTGTHTPISTKIAAALEATLADSCSHPLPNLKVTFTAPPAGGSSPSGVFETSGTETDSFTTDANGKVSVGGFVTNSKASAGSYDVVAKSATNPAASTITFTLYNDPGKPVKIVPEGAGSATDNRQNVTVDTTVSSGSFLRATVYDAGNNKVFPSPTGPAGSDYIKIVFDNSTPNGSGAGASFTTGSNVAFPDSNGIINMPLPLQPNTVAGDYEIVAKPFNNPTTSTWGTFYLHNSPDKPVSIVASPVTGDNTRLQQKITLQSNPSASQAFTTSLSVTVKDKHGNLIPGVSINFKSNPGTSTIHGQPNSKPTANFGVVPTTSTTAQPEYTGTTGTSGAGLGVITAPTVFPGFYAGKYTITAAVTPQPADGPVAVDFYMQNLPDQTPKAVSITASSSELFTTVKTAFPEFSAHVTDANGNGIPSKPVTFALNGTIANGIWSQHPADQSIEVQTNDNGDAVINQGILTRDTTPTSSTQLEANDKAGNFKVIATVATTTDIDPTGFIHTDIQMNNEAERRVLDAKVSFTGPADTAQPVDQTFGAFTVTVADPYDNPINNYPVTFAVPVTGTTAPTAAFVDAPASTTLTINTNSSGVATLASGKLQAGIVAGNFNLTAKVTVTPTDPTEVVKTVSLTNEPGAPFGPNITNSSNGATTNVTVNNTKSLAITIRVADKYNNEITGSAVKFTVEPGTNSAAATALVPALNTEGNVQTISSITVNTKAGTYAIKPWAGGIASTNLIQFRNTADFADVITAVSGNNQTPDVGNQFSAGLAVSLVDKYNNPVEATDPNGNPTTVTFTAPALGASAVFTDPSTGLSTGNTVTVATLNGTATIAKTNITANTEIGPYDIQTSVPGATPTTTATFHVTNLARITAVSTTRVIKLAGGEAFSGQDSLQVKVAGSGGAGVKNQSVTFSVPDSTYGVFRASGNCTSPSSANGTVISVTVKTNNQGIATVSNYCAGNLIGNYDVTATTTIAGTPVSTAVQVANTANLGLESGNNQSKLAGGEAFDALKVNVKGFNTTPIPNAQVTFAIADSTWATPQSTLTPLTDVNGLASLQLNAGTFVGGYNVTATFVNPTTTQTQTFSLNNTVKVVFTSTPPSLLAAGTATPTDGQTQALNTQVQGFNNVGLNGITVEYTISDTQITKGFIASGTSTPTSTGSGGSAGSASATLQAGTVLGVYNIVATPKKSGNVVGTLATIQATTTANLTTTSAPTPKAGGETVAVAATVRGNNGNPVVGAGVNFNVPGGNFATLAVGVTNPVTSTTGTGVAQANITTGSAAGQYNITATLDPAQFGGAAQAATVTIPVTNKVTITIAANKSELLAGGTTSNGATQVTGESATLTGTVGGFGTSKISGVTLTLNVTPNNSSTAYFDNSGTRTSTFTTGASASVTGQTTATLFAGGSLGVYTVTVQAFVGGTLVSDADATTNGFTKATITPSVASVQMLAGGESKTITVLVQGNSSANVNGASVIFGTSETGTSTLGSLSAATPVTVNSNVNGVASVSISSLSKLGFYKVTGALAVPSGAPVMQWPLPVETTIINTGTISSTANLSPLAGASSVGVPALVKGYLDQPVNAGNVKFTVNDGTFANFGGSPVSLSTVIPLSSGTATASMTSLAKAGTYSISAAIDQAQYTDSSNTVIWTVPAAVSIPAKNTVTLAYESTTPVHLKASSSASATDGESAAVKVNVGGAGGVAVSNVSVGFDVDNTGKGTILTNPVDATGSVTSLTTNLRAGNEIGGPYNIAAQAKVTGSSTVTVSTQVTLTAYTDASFATDVTTNNMTPLAGGAASTITLGVTGNSTTTGVANARVRVTSSDATKGTIEGSETYTYTASSTGAVTVNVQSGNKAGPYQVTATLVDVAGGTPPTKTFTITNTVTLETSLSSLNLLTGGESKTLQVTAKGANNTPISGVTLSFTAPSTTTGPTGTASAGGATDATGKATVTVASTSNSGGYGAWTLGFGAKVGTTDVYQAGSTPPTVSVVNTLQIAMVTNTTLHPLLGGGTDPASSASVTAKVTGFTNYNPGSGVQVNFSSAIVTDACGGDPCGTVITPAQPYTTDASGLVTGTVRSRSGPATDPTLAEAYDISASVTVNAVTNSTSTAVHVINTVRMVNNGASLLNLNPTSPLSVTVQSATNQALSGYVVELTVRTSDGSAMGNVDNDGYLCLKTCAPGTSTKYLGAQIITPGSGTISGTAGVNYAIPVSKASVTGTSNYVDAGGATGVDLVATGSQTIPHSFILRARVIVPGLQPNEYPVIDFNILTVVPPSSGG